MLDYISRLCFNHRTYPQTGRPHISCKYAQKKKGGPVNMNKIRLSEHFTYTKLLRFVFPSITMMIFTSIYSVVDGLFVSNYAGKTPFAALNLIYPLLMITGALGFMVGTGGTAIVARTLGEGRREDANRYFTMLVWVTVIGGVIITLAGQIFLPAIAVLFGASGEILDNCVLYGRIVQMAMPFFMLQNVFQSFFVTAEKPKLGLAVTVASGCTNIVLDALFVAVFSWGLAGAALATAISQIVGGTVPLIYFSKENSSLLRFCKTKYYGRVLANTCINGSSELMNSVASSIVTILFNFQLLRLAGEDGVAAFGVIAYISFIFAAIFLGYAVGSAPIVGFHYGAGHPDELKSLLRKSLTLMGLGGIAMTLLSLALSAPVSRIFVGYDDGLYAMTVRGFRIYSAAFLLCGFNIYGSAFFTALNNGLVSAVISFLRSLVFQSVCVLLLPIFLGLDGIWLALLASELLSLAVTVCFLIKNGKKYRYI